MSLDVELGRNAQEQGTRTTYTAADAVPSAARYSIAKTSKRIRKF